MSLTRKQFHEACKQLRVNLNAGEIRRRYGICTNLGLIIADKFADKFADENWYVASDLVEKYARGWFKHSGDSRFPVGGQTTYGITGDKWIGMHGKDRVELLNYLIRNTR
jgi:hypothetical protein